jgi:hypothetical protein
MKYAATINGRWYAIYVGKEGSEMAYIPEHLANRCTKVFPLCKTWKTAGHDFTCGKKHTKAQAHQRAKKSKENKEAPLATEVEDGSQAGASDPSDWDE